MDSTTGYEDEAAGYALLAVDSARCVGLVLPAVRQRTKTTSVLDVGSGPGVLFTEKARKGIADVMGVYGNRVDRMACFEG